MTKAVREHVADALEALAGVAQDVVANPGRGALPLALRQELPGLEPVHAAIRHLRSAGWEPLQWSERMNRSAGPQLGDLHYIEAKTPVGDYAITWWASKRQYDTYAVHFNSGGRGRRLGGIGPWGPETLEQAKAVAQNHFNDTTGGPVPAGTSTISDVRAPRERDEAREILEDLLNAAHRGVYSDGFTREAVRRAERLLAPPEWSELDNEAWLEARKQHALMALEEKGGAPVRGTP